MRLSLLKSAADTADGKAAGQRNRAAIRQAGDHIGQRAVRSTLLCCGNLNVGVAFVEHTVFISDQDL